jgi:hypothetical protein
LFSSSNIEAPSNLQTGTRIGPVLVAYFVASTAVEATGQHKLDNWIWLERTARIRVREISEFAPLPARSHPGQL